MANYYNYYGIRNNFAWHFKSYVRFSYVKYCPSLFRLSNEVWCEGPMGGVRHERSDTVGYTSGYITKNETEMKKFMWVKLKAISLNEREFTERG